MHGPTILLAPICVIRKVCRHHHSEQINKKTKIIMIAMKRFLISYFLFFASYFTLAQNNVPWHGKKCAVVLTYDDALNVDLTNAIPELDSAGLKGTFYISDYFNGLNAQLFKWRSAAV